LSPAGKNHISFIFQVAEKWWGISEEGKGRSSGRMKERGEGFRESPAGEGVLKENPGGIFSCVPTTLGKR
jgi:hypothetical protein